MMGCKKMQIFPAVDIKDKKAVRLTRGDYDQMKVYSSDPQEVAKSFASAGAKNVHLVDLDGAKDGCLANFDVIKSIVETCGLFVEVGGGVRDEERIAKYLDCGAGRVIIGTAAVENFEFVKNAVKRFGNAVAVGVDAKDERVAIHGWKTVTDVDSLEFCKRLRDAGVATVIYTDVAKDGVMQGTNLQVYEKLAAIKGLNVIASGGITFLDELKQLSAMGIHGAILGKALYEGVLDLREALKIR